MKMSNEYLHVQTSQLRPLVEHLYGKAAWDQKGWENLGSTSTAINLDDIDGANMIQTPEHETHYLLPIIDPIQANKFRVDCGVVGLEVEVLSYDDAIIKWNELKALKE